MSLFSSTTNNPSFLNRSGSLFDQPNGMNGGNNLFAPNQGGMGNNLFSNQNAGNWNNSMGLGMNSQGGMNMNSNNLFSQQNNMNSLFNTNTNNMGLNMGMQNNSSSLNLFSSSGGSINTRSMMNQKAGTTKRKFAPTASVKDSGWFVHTINHMVDYSGKSLEELRAEDYNNMKTGNLPDNWKTYVSQKIQELRSAGIPMNVSSTQMGGMNLNMGSNNQNMFLGGSGGGMNSNNLFSSSGNNNLFLNSNGNLFSQNNGNNLFSNSGGGNMMGNNLFSGNNQNLFNQGMNSGGNMNLFSNNSGGNNMGMMNNNSGVNNLFNRQNSGSNVSLFSNNTMGNNLFNQQGNNLFNQQGNNLFNQQGNNLFNQGNNLFNQGTNQNNLFSGQSNYSLFPNNQQNMSLFPNNQGNLFNQNQSQNLFSNTQGNNAYQIMARNAQYGMQGGFNMMGGNQQLFPQGGYQNMLFPGQGMNMLFPTQGGFMYPGIQAPMQVLPTGQVIQYPQQPYFMYPQQSSSYSTGSQAQQGSSTNNKSFSLFSLSGQESNFDDTTGFGLRERRPLSERTNAFRRSSADIPKRFTARLDRSADDILRSSRFTPQFFEDKRREMAYKSRGRINSASTLEIIFTKRNDSFFEDTRRRKDYLEEDFDFTGRNASFRSVDPHKSRHFLSQSLTRSNRNRSVSPSVMRSFEVNRDRLQDDVIKVNAAVSIPDEEKSISVSINKAEKIQSLKYLLLKEMKCVNITNYIKSATIYFNSRVLKNEDSLQESGIKNEDWVAFVVDENALENSSALSKKRTQESLIKKSADASLLPTLTKPGYYTEPSLDELSKYTENELKHVEGFVVGNQNGRIHFLGPTDVTGLDLDVLVEINEKFAEVYPEALFPTEESKPPVGTKLNKPSEIALYNCFFEAKDKTDAEIIEILKKKAAKNGSELVSYDKVGGVYTIKVPHFTRYGFEESDDEEEEKDQQEPKKRKNIRDEKNKSRTAPLRTERTENREEPERRTGLNVEGDHQTQSSIRLDEQSLKGVPVSQEIKETQRRGPILPTKQLEEVNEEEEDELFGKDGVRNGYLEGASNLEQELLDIEKFIHWIGETGNQKDIIEEDVRQKVGLQQDIENHVLTLNRKLFEYQPQKLQDRPVATRKEFSLHKSFRVGWTRDGIAVPSCNSKGCSQIEIHKVILHKDLYSSKVNPEKSYTEYQKRLKGLITKIYEPLMRELVNASFSPQKANEPAILATKNDRTINQRVASSQPRFPAKGPFLKALAHFTEYLSSGEYSYEEIAVADEDLETFSLFNILFGNPDFDLQEYGAKARSMTPPQKEIILEEIEASEEILGDKFYTDYARKNALSKWLEVKATKLIEDIMRHEEYEEESWEHAIKLIKLFLSAKKIRRASQKAGDANLKHLENILISLSNLKVPGALLKEAQIWDAQNETQNHAYKQVYDLLSGQDITYKDMEWIRKLGIRIWFLEKPQQRFENIFEKFQGNEAKRSPDILSGWNLNSIDKAIADLKILDLYYILMSFFCKPDTKFLYKHLNTYSRSTDVLDTKHLWIIYEYLKHNLPEATSMKADKEEKAFRYRLLKSFAYQLELIGLWEYAIFLFVIASKDIAPKKLRAIREIVHRNYKTIGRKRYKRSKLFLESKLQVPQEFTIESKAFKYMSNCIFERASKNFLKCKQYQTAFNLLSTVVAPRIISGESYGEEMRRLEQYLDELKKNSRVQWTNEGEAIRLFIEIRHFFEKKKNWNVEVDSLLDQVSKLHKLICESGGEGIGDYGYSSKSMLRKRGDLENIMLAKVLSELFRVALEEVNYWSFLKHKKWFKNYMQIMPNEFKEANHASYLKMIELYCSTCP